MAKDAASPFVFTAFRHATLLCLCAGFADAFGYFDLGRVFTANMTGNTVLLGIALASADWQRAITSVVAIGAFFIGACVASSLRHATRRGWPWFLLSAALLIPVDVVPLTDRAELFLMGFAMGVQGASLGQFGPTRLRTVVVTGTLLRLADTVTKSRGDAATARDGTIVLTATSWASYAIGAALGIKISPLTPALPLAVPIALLCVVALDLALSEHP